MPGVNNILIPEIEDWSKLLEIPGRPATTPGYKKMYDDSVKMFNIDRNRSAVTAEPRLHALPAAGGDDGL